MGHCFSNFSGLGRLNDPGLPEGKPLCACPVVKGAIDSTGDVNSVVEDAHYLARVAGSGGWSSARLRLYIEFCPCLAALHL